MASGEVSDESARPTANDEKKELLGPSHFAFYRAYLEGDEVAVDLGELAHRYLTIDDPRRVTKLVQRLQDQLTAAARRVGDHKSARLIRLPRLRRSGTAAPLARMSLEEFKTLRDPDDFYQEGELLDLYNDEFPPSTLDRKTMRNARLHKRRLEALERLEQLVAVAPRPTHSLFGWLEPRVARRLKAVEILTIEQLRACINARGFRWFDDVPRLGETGANRIVNWLKANEATVGKVSLLASQPLRQLVKEVGIVKVAIDRSAGIKPGVLAPLEMMVVPADLDGRAGLNRRLNSMNQIAADNDLDAIHAWLRHKRGSEHTRRGYRTQAERLLMWAIFQKGKALSSLTVDDANDYMLFLANPQPQNVWIGPRNVERWSPLWRPFSGKLSPSSRVTAHDSLKAMMGWLVKMKYLDGNPFSGISLTGEERDANQDVKSRSLSPAIWAHVVDCLLALPKDLGGDRARFIVFFAYGTGLRREELAKATTSMLSIYEDYDGLTDSWSINIKGKGSRKRRVPVPRLAMKALAAYLRSRGLPGDPTLCPVDTPLLAHVQGAPNRPLTADGVARVIKGILGRAADQLGEDQQRAAARLRAASTHWMRHTYATHAINAGVAPIMMQKNLGHASLDMVTVYNDEEFRRRLQAMEDFMA